MPLKKPYSKPKTKHSFIFGAGPLWKFWKRHPNDIAAEKIHPPGPKWGKDPLGVAGFSRKKKF